jgi:hypothetical protein
MTVTILGRGRRAGAIAAFRLASLVLRGGTTLYQSRTISRPTLRAMLSVSQALERAGVLFAFGRRAAERWQLPTSKRDNNDRVD